MTTPAPAHSTCVNPRCRNGSVDDDHGHPGRAHVTAPAVVCDPCFKTIDKALQDLIELYLALYLALEPGTVSGFGDRVTGNSHAAPSPLNDEAEHLMFETCRLLESWEDYVRDDRQLTTRGAPKSDRAPDGRRIEGNVTHLPVRDGFALTRTVGFLRAHLDYLVTFAGNEDFIRELLDLRGSLVGFLGQYRGRKRLRRATCPSCQMRGTLVLWNGSDQVDCENPHCMRQIPVDFASRLLDEDQEATQ